MENYRWSEDNAAEIKSGWIIEADTIENLGVKLGISGAQLRETIAEYNRACEIGVDRQMGRDPGRMSPISEPPFYAFPWGNVLVFTCGGPTKDELGRALDPFGAPIRGLYAAGEVASTYSQCMAAAQMLADAMAFGRIAGRNCAAEPQHA